MYINQTPFIISIARNSNNFTFRKLQVLTKAIKTKQAESNKDLKVVLLRHIGLGFGNLSATVENILPGCEEVKLPEAAEKFVMAASNCCNKVCGACCCMCCIQACSRINNQCAILLTQIVTSFACLGCISCCELCCSAQEWCYCCVYKTCTESM